MPAITLYGRRWHFSSDIVALPALLAALFHAAWLIILLVWAAAKSGWPGRCESGDGTRYVALLAGLLATFGLNLALDLLLAWQSLRGAPFEVSKRQWVAPLLYACTLPLVATLGLTVYGTYVCTHLQPDCWPVDQRNAVTNISQGLVFSTWGFMFIASLGIAITYNMFPQHHDLDSWEARCECLASALCCHANVVRRPDGKRPPLTNIAELTAGLLSHCDLDATDITAALFLASAAQNRRRRLRVAKALLPVYKAMRAGAASSSAGSDRGAGSGGAGFSGSEGGGDGDDDDAASTDGASSSSSLNEVPNDRELDRMIAEQQAQQAAQQAARQAQQAQQARRWHPHLESAGPAAANSPHAAMGIGGAIAGQSDPQTSDLQQAREQVARQGARGRHVSWAQDGPVQATAFALEPVAVLAQQSGAAVGQLSNPMPAVPQEEAERAEQQGAVQGVASVSPFAQGEAAPASPGGLASNGRPAGNGGQPFPVLAESREGQGLPVVGEEHSVPLPLLKQSAEGQPPPLTQFGEGHSVPLLSNQFGEGHPLPLTQETVAELDRRLAEMEAGQGSPTAGSPRLSVAQAAQAEAAEAAQAEAAELAGELMQDLPQDLSPHEHDVVGQLADAIEEEIRQLGGDSELPEDAVLQMVKEESLDLSALQVDPEAPSIWFSTGASSQGARDATLSEDGEQDGEATEATEPTEGLGPAAGAAGTASAAQQAAQEADELATDSPFFTAGGGSCEAAAPSSSSSSTLETVRHAARVEAAAALALGAPVVSSGKKGEDAGGSCSQPGEPPLDADVPPPADDLAASAVAEVAATAAAEAVSPKSGAGSLAGGSSTRGSQTSKLDLSRQLTMRYPVVITPSEHVEGFRGPLPAAALADIYAGRHEKVPSSVLQEAVHFLKYSYAVYSLQPKVEAPSSALDVLACLPCYSAPPDPQKVVYKGLSELEELGDDSSVELLHLNCSNRVLAHLPYMICLDHGRRAVVLAIRGTISAADMVTDAIVYPEALDNWLPQQIKEELEGPVFAHAGVVAAARAIFEDMTERGILQQLVEEEAVGDYTAPQGQHAQRDGAAATAGASSNSNGGAGRGNRRQGGSQYDADAGGSGPECSQYWPQGSRGGAVASQHVGVQGDEGALGLVAPLPADATSAVNLQSAERGGAAGRLWEGASAKGAADDGSGRGSEGSAGSSTRRRQQGDGQAHAGTSQRPAAAEEHVSMYQLHREEASGQLPGAEDKGQLSPGRRVGELMRRKIQEEGWQLIVQGHSLGAGAAALVSLKLLEHYPGLKCIAYSCPGGLVSKNLAHAMASFTTTVVVGKDAVCRATVGNLTRLMDEMVTALARCRQPKLKVLFYPWWRRRKTHFRKLFWDYDQIPAESLEVLQRYYESRARIGQPLSMYPPGRVIFLRPIKTRVVKEWDAVWIQPEDIIAEGLLVSPHMLRDHLCSTAYEALTAAAARMKDMESGAPSTLSGTADARPHMARQLRQQRAAARRELRRRQEAAQRRARQRIRAQRTSSLQDVLIEAS